MLICSNGSYLLTYDSYVITMARFLPFDTFWDLALAQNNTSNGLYYHPCCDVWTTRAAKAKRASHKDNINWRRALNSLDKSVDDKKHALLAKMTEEGWRLPVVLNEACKAMLPQTLQQQSAFRPHIPVQPPQDLQPIIADQDFIYPDQLPLGLITPSSNHYFT